MTAGYSGLCWAFAALASLAGLLHVAGRYHGKALHLLRRHREVRICVERPAEILVRALQIAQFLVGESPVVETDRAGIDRVGQHALVERRQSLGVPLQPVESRALVDL